MWRVVEEASLHNNIHTYITFQYSPYYHRHGREEGFAKCGVTMYYVLGDEQRWEGKLFGARR